MGAEQPPVLKVSSDKGKQSKVIGIHNKNKE